MLHKLALAVKSKTIELFADEEANNSGDDDDDVILSSLPSPSAPIELIPNQRVLVIKPDNRTQTPAPAPPEHEIVAAAALSAVASFHAAYLHLRSARSPFAPDAVAAADRAAVSQLRRLSDLKRLFFGSFDADLPPISDLLAAQVRENQDLLRTFEDVVNRLQFDIDRKDLESMTLDQRLRDVEASVAKLGRRLEVACTPHEEKVEALLTVGVFDSVLRDTCRVTHRFVRVLVELMRNCGLDLGIVGNCIRPGVNFVKTGHCRYAILSYVCLGMFGGFDSCDFGCCEGDGIEFDKVDVTIRRNDSLQHFIEHSAVDAMELIRLSPGCEFSEFCRKKYGELINSGLESSLFGNLELGVSALGSFQPSNPLYEPFVSMASSVWMLHKLAWAYDPVVEIFQVAQGTEFSMVFMENIIRLNDKNCNMVMDCRKTASAKVGFTVVPGFRVRRTVVQCRVYLDGQQKAT